MLSSNLAAFRAKFEGLVHRLHKLVGWFGEIGDSDKEREAGEDELIRLEVLAAAGQLSAKEWKRQRELEEEAKLHPCG